MAWKPFSGPTKLQWYPKTVSTAFTAGAVVDVISGFLVVADITRASHSGIMQKTVVSTDSDYASATRLPIMVPASLNTKFRVSVLAADTGASTDVGNFLDLAGSPVGIDVTNASSDDDAFLCTDFLSARELAGHLNCFKPMKNGLGTAA